MGGTTEREATIAYVLIKAELGAAKQVAEGVSGIGEVLYADIVTGPYDVIAAVYVPSNRELGDAMIEKIQTVEGVKNPLTAVVSSNWKDGEAVPMGHSYFP
ncbi:MAG: Lrp/AsnC family transcriptional regulator [Anaerolineae bacterium]